MIFGHDWELNQTSGPLRRAAPSQTLINRDSSSMLGQKSLFFSLILANDRIRGAGQKYENTDVYESLPERGRVIAVTANVPS